MTIKYTVLDPAKNITIIVQTPVKKQDRRFVADLLMKQEPSSEQVGFLKGNVLDMAGEEFCGNATRCAAVLAKANTIICAGLEIKCDGTAAFIPKELDGIKHFIKLEMMPKEQAEEEIKKQSNGDAIGFMFFDESKMELKPLVYVPTADTLYWENSCASGSVAVGKYLSEKYCKEIDVDLKQPGGILKVKTSPEDKYVVIDGKVDIIKTGELCIPELNY